MNTTSAPTLRTASRSSGKMNLRLKLVKPLCVLTVMTVRGATAGVSGIRGGTRVERLLYRRARQQAVGRKAGTGVAALASQRATGAGRAVTASPARHAVDPQCTSQLP